MKSQKKASVHVSIDPVLAERLHRVCNMMGIPVSHFASLALSREIARFEVEFSASINPTNVATNA